jgi:hypothetical protein
MMFWWYSLGLGRRVDWVVEANVSEKRAVSIFWAQDEPTNQSTWALTKKDIIRTVTTVKTLNFTKLFSLFHGTYLQNFQIHTI